jgi:biopolymer transport protein ExbD
VQRADNHHSGRPSPFVGMPRYYVNITGSMRRDASRAAIAVACLATMVVSCGTCAPGPSSITLPSATRTFAPWASLKGPRIVVDVAADGSCYVDSRPLSLEQVPTVVENANAPRVAHPSGVTMVGVSLILRADTGATLDAVAKVLSAFAQQKIYGVFFAMRRGQEETLLPYTLPVSVARPLAVRPVLRVGVRVVVDELGVAKCGEVASRDTRHVCEELVAKVADARARGGGTVVAEICTAPGASFGGVIVLLEEMTAAGIANIWIDVRRRTVEEVLTGVWVFEDAFDGYPELPD